jgi:hypothetical protein
MYKWSPNSKLCEELRTKAKEACHVPYTDTITATAATTTDVSEGSDDINTTISNADQHQLPTAEFELTMNVQRDIPIIVDDIQVGTYEFNLLAIPSIAAINFCSQASSLLGKTYEKESCLQFTAERFKLIRHEFSSDPDDSVSPQQVLNSDNSETNQEIPLLLHQTWKTRTVPPKFQQWRQSWLKNHPHWVEQHVWSDEDNLKLIQLHFPELVNVYQGFRHTILRVDFVRYVMMYIHGGVYADLDVESLQPLDSLLTRKHSNIVLGLESENSDIVDISFMASIPGHPFWLDVIRCAVASDGLKRVRDVLEITGNKMFTRVLKHAVSIGAASDIVVYDVPIIYAPCYRIEKDGSMNITKGYAPSEDCRCGEVIDNKTGIHTCNSCRELFPTSYIAHHETGTWVKSFWKL